METKVQRPIATSDESVLIRAGSVVLEGTLSVPVDAAGVVIFAHGSGSSRHSPRNSFVARELQESKFATLLFDLLTEREDVDFRARFEIALLTERLKAATHWIGHHRETAALDAGYFGASTGAAAALYAAAELGGLVAAVVSRGGRPDLASAALARVQTPTLLIVGELDEAVLKLNRRAYEALPGTKELAVVSGATHLFEEPGALEEVARLAADWFERHLARAPARASAPTGD